MKLDRTFPGSDILSTAYGGLKRIAEVIGGQSGGLSTAYGGLKLVSAAIDL